MILQNISQSKPHSVIETVALLNNGRKQIVISSSLGPYSSVTYLYDYDGNILKPLCREPSKQELSSEYNEIFKDHPDNGFCTFFASRGKSIEDVDNDKIKEIIIINNLVNHVCPAVRIITYKWNGKIFAIKSEEESQRPDLKECSSLPSVYPVTTNSYPDSGKKCSDGIECQSGWCLDQSNSLNWKCSPVNIFIFDPQQTSVASEFVVINSKVFFVYSPYPYSSSHFRTIDIGIDDGSQEFKLLKERLCTRKINDNDPKITCQEGSIDKEVHLAL